MKIRSLQLKNIGVFEDETILFPEKKSEGAEIHILTGQNGTGKTTILQALASGMYEGKENKLIETIQKKCLSWSMEISEVKVFTEISIEPLIVISKGVTLSKKPFEYNPFKDPTSEVFRGYKFASFAYSGNRFIRHEENINIKENVAYNPLENALEFDKEYGNNDYSLNQWLANTISKRSFARDEGNEEKAKLFDKNIKFLEQIIQEIIEKSIKFEPVYETGIKIVANVNEKKLDFDLLPDGLRSIISWLGDLIMRMDALKWENDLDIRDREFILFLDEIEVHLHPTWQRKILPVVQKLFKNAQIFITTHSPFIVNSVDGAWIYDLELNNNSVTCKKSILSKASNSINYVLRKIFDVPELYGKPVQDKLDKFYEYRTEIMEGNLENKQSLLNIASDLIKLKDRTIEDRIYFELGQLGTEYAI